EIDHATADAPIAPPANRSRRCRGFVMDWDDVVVPFALIAILAVSAFAMALKSLLDHGQVRVELTRLGISYQALYARLEELRARVDELAPPRSEIAEPVPPPEPELTIADQSPAEPEPTAPGAAPPEPVMPQPAATAAQRWDWERLLVENWL